MSPFRAELVKAGVLDKIADAIISLGYDSAALFRAAFIDQPAFEKWLLKLRPRIEVAELAALGDDEWGSHPHAARLRMFWRAGLPQLVQPSSSDALAVVPPGTVASGVPVSGSKLNAAGREKMRRALEKNYSSFVVTSETLPALCYLQVVQQQATDKFWEWLPWRGILSEEQLLEVKARRGRSSSEAAPEEWGLELAGAALRVQQILETRAHAFAMVSACHLHSWIVYMKKFMALYARKPSEQFRAPTVQEAEAADRVVLDEVFQLCFSGHPLDDAITHVVVDRDMLRHVLIERPKVPKLEKEKPLATPTPSGLPPLPRKTDSKRLQLSQGPGRLPTKRVRNGECWLWVEGKCSNRSCRFKHECAICGDRSHHSALCPQQSSR